MSSYEDYTRKSGNYDKTREMETRSPRALTRSGGGTVAPYITAVARDRGRWEIRSVAG